MDSIKEEKTLKASEWIKSMWKWWSGIVWKFLKDWYFLVVVVVEEEEKKFFFSSLFFNVVTECNEYIWVRVYWMFFSPYLNSHESNENMKNYFDFWSWI